MEKVFLDVKEASVVLKNSSAEVRSAAIRRLGGLVRENEGAILKANADDVRNAERNGVQSSLIARLTLTSKKIAAISEALFTVAGEPDPVGRVIGGSTRPNSLRIVKVRVPLGVIGVIYESRPNVTLDCAALALRSGNAAILRGGKEAERSNSAFGGIIGRALKECGLPENSVALINDPDRTKLAAMLKADKYIDLIIPRGGEELIRHVTENSLVPLVKHDKGVCNIYVDKDADFEKALKIIHNAKTSYPSACNAVECVIVHRDIAAEFIPLMAKKLKESGVKLLGCERSAKTDGIEPITGGWGKEYLDLMLAVRVEDTLKGAVNFIAKFGSSHSDAIITENYSTANEFLKTVDSACVYINASTRFTDGGEFGLGAEVGISTQKLHARGPMGAYDLTTYKYIVYGNGQIRE
ncbi:MAG: glutamate-5-semialdehyde dehydrogenase [Deferribacteraceae bacterium]|jgi:glutamate-5-semialdehyde dehydrogenase|nr:glutamate-5-semialdehyde dehydrogenase [Deferribacteraceae bacterium]